MFLTTETAPYALALIVVGLAAAALSSLWKAFHGPANLETETLRSLPLRLKAASRPLAGSRR